MRCKRPPFGWRCSREATHHGPCAARQTVLGWLVSNWLWVTVYSLGTVLIFWFWWSWIN